MPKKLEDVFWFLIDYGIPLLTVVFAAFAVGLVEIGTLPEKEILKWLVLVIGLLVASEFVERVRMLGRIEQDVEKTRDLAETTSTQLKELWRQEYLPLLEPVVIPPEVNFQALTRELVKKWTDKWIEKNPVGPLEVPIQRLINFKRCEDQGDLLNLALAMFTMIKKQGCSFTRIAYPNTGVNFADRVAAFSRKPHLEVNVNPVEGYDFMRGLPPSPKDEIIVISDVALSGRSSLEIAIEKIIAMGAHVKHAFVLVERTDVYHLGKEGPKDRLRKLNVELHHCLQLSDEDLVKMKP